MSLMCCCSQVHVWRVGKTDAPVCVIGHTLKHTNSSSLSGGASLMRSTLGQGRTGLLGTSNVGIGGPQRPNKLAATKLAIGASLQTSVRGSDNSCMNNPFGADIAMAKFYYLDSFILMVTSLLLLLFAIIIPRIAWTPITHNLGDE